MHNKNHRRLGINLNFLIFLACFFLVVDSFGNSVLVSEIEKLRNSLTKKDPARSILTLRLADLLFDSAVDLNKKSPLTPPEAVQLENYRRKSARLYEESLLLEPERALPEAQKVKVQFQLARIYADLNEDARANALWKFLVVQEAHRDIRREAALRLAEWSEKKIGKENGEAEKFYRLAIELCQEGDGCSYGHYRLGWLLKNQGKLSEGIEQLRLGLWDSKGQVREEVLRDLVVFLSSTKTDGEAELNEIEAISVKLGRPQLLIDLAEGFFSSGNKPAGVKVLEYVQIKAPRSFFLVRLLEEHYGFRNWDRFRELLEEVKLIPANSVSLTERDGVEFEKILKRLMVQLDGERLSQPQFGKDFQSVALSYLRIFPGKDRMKIIEGWLASEKESQTKLTQLETWISEKSLNGAVGNEIRLREFRSDIAIKTQNHEVVATEMAALALLVPPQSPKQREYQFLQATALNESKKTDESLALLKLLARPTGPLDQWALKSQQLALHILTERKTYGELILQAELWTTDAKVKAESRWAKDLEKMIELSERARFEQAVALGQTKPALDLFQTYCLAKRFLPKSCDNARVLSLQLKDQGALLTILKEQNKTEELATEYEASGYFGAAAELLEVELKKTKRAAKLDIAQYLKIALLYELDDKTSEKERILGELIQKLPSQKNLEPLEEALMRTLSDAALLANPTLLRVAFTPLNKSRIAEALEAVHKATPETKKLLLAAPQSTGPAWNAYARATLDTLNQKQQKIGIYGRNSKKNFEKRVAGLRELAQAGESLIQKAASPDKAAMVELLGTAYQEFAKTILESPLPKGLTEEDLKQVQSSLAELAAPFNEKAEGYKKIAESLNPKIAETPVAAAPGGAVVPAIVPDVKQALAQLHSDPTSKEALTTIREFYRIPGQLRLSSYFEGRLQQLKEEATR